VPYLSYSLLLLFAFGLLTWLVRPHRFRHYGWIAAIPPALVVALLLANVGQVAEGDFHSESFTWAPQLNLELSLLLDGLGLLFGVIIAGIGTAVALYTGYYLEDDSRQGYFYLLLFAFMASMLGIVWTDNLLAVFVFWEGTSVTSYLLIGYYKTRRDAIDGARRALIVTGLGGLAMLFGLVLLGQIAGTYTISAVNATAGLTDHPLYPVALVLLLLGAFTKSAQFPFHFWLPGAMAAPTPASAYLHSATMVKAGIFLLARLHPALSDSDIWFSTLFLIGGITMLVGAVGAFRYYDIKALLANATVSQLGILVMLLAFRSEVAYLAVTVGILAHALYKGPLFLIAGIVDHATGTRDLRRFGGLRSELPIVAWTAVLAALSMAGIPPLFGFVGKEAFLEPLLEFYEAGPSLFAIAGIVAAGIAGALFTGYSATLAWELFFRAEPESGEHAHVHHAPSLSFILPPLVLTLLGTIAPFTLAWLDPTLIGLSASAIAGHHIEDHIALWHGLTPGLLISAVAIVTGIGLFLYRARIRALLQSLPRWMNGVTIFDRVVYALYDLANLITQLVQGGSLSAQSSIVLLVAGLVVVYSLTHLTWDTALQIDWGNFPHLAEVVLALMLGIAAIVTIRARERLNSIISLGVVGIVVTLYFVFFSAPDLALTQLLVDVLTIVLMILVFYRIPPQALPAMSTALQARNILVSLAAGILGFIMALHTVGQSYAESIGSYFSLNAVDLAHGGNIVNVILVDFRGFDTLGEITVLSIAAIGGYALLRSVLFQPRAPVQPNPSENSDSPQSGGKS
jgi:multicomponent Na+:H+ antiporter subunit A